jgi:hypothetical protein
MRIVMTVLVILLLIPVVGFASYLWYQPVTKLVDGIALSSRMPEELRGAFLYGTEDGVSTQYRLDIFGLRETRSGEFFMPTGVESPDGTRVVYAQKTATQDPVPFISGLQITPHEWSIYERTKEGTASAPLVEGYAPGYIDDTHVVYLTDVGISVLDLTTGSSAVIFTFPEGMIPDSMVRYAPNRSFMLLKNATTGEVLIGSLSVTHFTPLNVIKSDQPDNFILTDTGLYDARMNKGSFELWKQGHGGETPQYILTVPASLGLRSILL